MRTGHWGDMKKEENKMAKIRTKQIRQIGILVRDLEKSVAAFERFLGMKADFVGVTKPDWPGTLGQTMLWALPSGVIQFGEHPD